MVGRVFAEREFDAYLGSSGVYALGKIKASEEGYLLVIGIDIWSINNQNEKFGLHDILVKSNDASYVPMAYLPLPGTIPDDLVVTKENKQFIFKDKENKTFFFIFPARKEDPLLFLNFLDFVPVRIQKPEMK